MIKEVLLACALAVPSTNFTHPDLSICAVRVIHLMTRMESDPFFSHNKRSYDKRVILIGLPTQWIDSFLSMGFLVWRLAFLPVHRRDIGASVIEQPLRRDSIHVIIYGGDTGRSAWSAMRILSQAVFALQPMGYIIFSDKLCPRWARYLESAHFERIPFLWHNMSIWQKPKWKHSLRTVYFIDEAA